jgi:hypothetical protein
VLVVSGITATLSGKTPSPRIGVYSPLVGLTLSLGIGSSYLGAPILPPGRSGVVEEVLYFTSTTLPLFPD